MDPRAVRLRPAGPEDMEFLRTLHRAAMREHVERTYGPWDDADQRQRFDASTDPATHDIIELDGTPVGCRWVRRHPDALELVRLYLMPDAQGQGVGTHVVRSLLDDATRVALPVRLRVMKTNPARRLYERLGFVVTAETETHFAMHAAARDDTKPE